MYEKNNNDMYLEIGEHIRLEGKTLRKEQLVFYNAEGSTLMENGMNAKNQMKTCGKTFLIHFFYLDRYA